MAVSGVGVEEGARLLVELCDEGREEAACATQRVEEHRVGRCERGSRIVATQERSADRRLRHTGEQGSADTLARDVGEDENQRSIRGGEEIEAVAADLARRQKSRLEAPAIAQGWSVGNEGRLDLRGRAHLAVEVTFTRDARPPLATAKVRVGDHADDVIRGARTLQHVIDAGPQGLALIVVPVAPRQQHDPGADAVRAEHLHEAPARHPR